ncbi:MAG: enoyl-CoA hydratase/isomerase family protein [Phycisphaerales bacterium]|nr:enoyl-CoA hydratase/isomerase family protein [Phycisphaerales bacterium]MCI0631696.1 enoyl-CoA hydratase/isomerase family protein [Phycisphaerales bacterium]MCI0674773.1 enoyl-CoA hydratase/isomerase family protein [Phycisphaerales bacterium]
MPQLVQVKIADGIATLMMNRPEARNALSLELIVAMNEAVEQIGKQAKSGSDNVRVMILAGAGKVFCAGMDLKGVLHDPKAMGEMLRGLSMFLRRVRRLPIPTIARVQGAAVGGGCGLMVVTDFAFTHAEAKVGYPEVDLGVCPAVVAPWLIKKIGPGRARAMLLAGGTMTGKAGFEAGLASHLVNEKELEAATLQLANSLVKGGPHAMAVTKQWLNELDGSMEEAPFEKAAELSAQVIAGEEAQSRLRAILR